MSDVAAIKATFSDFRLIKGRKQAQLVLEVPIEQADNALAALGGIPQPHSDRCHFKKSPSNLERSIADAIEGDRKWAALAQSDAEPVVDEDAVDAAFDTWAKPRGYRIGNRLSFHAGVEFGLRHARERLNADVRALRQQIAHYHGKWGKRDD
jgi:hypothetical protein